MQITIFAKKRTTKDGRNFVNFISRLTRKDGSTITAQVKIPEEKRPRADECPMNIIVSKDNANLAETSYIREDTGELATRYALWVSDFERGEPYVDHSLDDFED